MCIAGQYLVHVYTWAAKTIVIFKFRDFVSEESSESWVGFLHLNLLILRVLHSYVEDKGLLIKLRVEIKCGKEAKLPITPR